MTVNTVAMGCCGLLLAALPFMAGAQDSSKMSAGSSTVKGADKIFASKAAQGGMAEVQMGKLAADKATNADVKAFGQQMVDDHTKANDELKSMAQKDSLTLPMGPSAKQKAMYNRLNGMSGANFDRAYVKAMVMDHEEDVSEFQKEANSGQNADIKNFASSTLPVIEGHLDKIKSIHSKMTSTAK